mmetsp:Transcript_24479/g.50848  ORF Transcript_24479/g.50848 Transcript_24479/m.50848 type:complete len:295 (+) Transcript_24479:2037-2921(+)
MESAPLLGQQGSQRRQHHRLELFKVDGLGFCDQVDGQQVALLLKVHRAGDHLHQDVKDFQQLVHPSFGFLAHDFATEGAHACETEGFSAVFVGQFFSFSLSALFTFLAFLAFVAFLALFGLFFLRCLVTFLLFIPGPRGLHRSPVFLDHTETFAIGVTHELVAGAAIAEDLSPCGGSTRRESWHVVHQEFIERVNNLIDPELRHFIAHVLECQGFHIDFQLVRVFNLFQQQAEAIEEAQRNHCSGCSEVVLESDRRSDLQAVDGIAHGFAVMSHRGQKKIEGLAQHVHFGGRQS